MYQERIIDPADELRAHLEGRRVTGIRTAARFAGDREYGVAAGDGRSLAFAQELERRANGSRPATVTRGRAVTTPAPVTTHCCRDETPGGASTCSVCGHSRPVGELRRSLDLMDETPRATIARGVAALRRQLDAAEQI